MRMLYHLWLSAGSRKVRIAMGEKNLPFEMKVEKTWERRPEFLDMNPAGDVPVLIADTDLARRLFNWSARRSIADACRDAIRWARLA